VRVRLIPTLSFVIGLSVILTFAQTRKPTTNQDVLQMVKAGFQESVIIKAIGANETNFDVSPQALIDLKNAGVSQNTIESMIDATARKRKAKASSTASQSSRSSTESQVTARATNNTTRGSKTASTSSVHLKPPVRPVRKSIPPPVPPPDISMSPNLPPRDFGDPSAKPAFGSAGSPGFAGGVGTTNGTSRPSQVTQGLPPLPTSFGFYVLDGSSIRELVPVAVVIRIGLTVAGGSGYPGIAVDGLAGDPPLRLGTAIPTLVIYQQLIDVSGFHLVNLRYVSTMQAFEFNMNGTAPEFFQNVFKRGYYDVIPVDLWRPQSEFRLRIEPAENKNGVYKLSPPSMHRCSRREDMPSTTGNQSTRAMSFFP
jgi:hypothetical protein